MGLDPTGGDETDQLAHVLDGPDRRVHDRGVLVEEHERVQLDRAVAGGRQPHAHEEAAGTQHIEAEVEAGDLRREHECSVDPAVCCKCRGCVGSLHRVGGSHRARELEAVGPDVHADDLVPEGGRHLDGVVAEPTGGADDGHRPAGHDPVLDELLDGAVRGEPAARQRGLEIVYGIGHLDERRRPDREVLGEGTEDRPCVRTVTRRSPEAVLAGAAPVRPARAAESEDDAVACADEALGLRTHGLDDADGLVPDEAHRPDGRPVPFGEMQVRVANARSGDVHESLVGLRFRDRQIVNPHAAVFVECRLHPPLASSSAPRLTLVAALLGILSTISIDFGTL